MYICKCIYICIMVGPGLYLVYSSGGKETPITGLSVTSSKRHREATDAHLNNPGHPNNPQPPLIISSGNGNVDKKKVVSDMNVEIVSLEIAGVELDVVITRGHGCPLTSIHPICSPSPHLASNSDPALRVKAGGDEGEVIDLLTPVFDSLTQASYPNSPNSPNSPLSGFSHSHPRQSTVNDPHNPNNAKASSGHISGGSQDQKGSLSRSRKIQVGSESQRNQSGGGGVGSENQNNMLIPDLVKGWEILLGSEVGSENKSNKKNHNKHSSSSSSSSWLPQAPETGLEEKRQGKEKEKEKKRNGGKNWIGEEKYYMDGQQGDSFDG